MTDPVPLPVPPANAPWPTATWEEGPPGPGVDAARLGAILERLVAEPAPEDLGETHAVVVVHRGRIVAERYPREHPAESRLVSWSMAKSVTHALVGILVGEERLEPGRPAPVPAWRRPGDPRGAITLEHLLRMVDGLEFVEDYVDAGISHVIEMLFGEGKGDVAGYAESRPLAHAPGTVWNYSSGTSNVVAAIVGRCVGGDADAMHAFMRSRLFDPIGMSSAEPRFDDAGTFIGSSFVFATARDFARFGLLYLRDGIWAGRRILPEGWVDHARRQTPASNGEYGAHWWLRPDRPGVFYASGYRGQYTIVDPGRDLVLVRLGGSTPEQRVEVVKHLDAVADSFPPVGPARGA